MEILLTPLAMATALGERCGSVWISDDTSITLSPAHEQQASDQRRVGNREEALNDMYSEVIRAAFQSIDFTFTIATTVSSFITQASDSSTNLAILMPPGNIDSDPVRPNTTAQEEAVHVIQAIKTAHPIPLIVIAAHPITRETVLAAGADCFPDIPAESTAIRNAVGPA